MDNKKLVIPSKPYKGESSIVSIRIPDELLKKIDETSNNSGRTRTEIILMCLEFAVDNIEVQGDNK